MAQRIRNILALLLLIALTGLIVASVAAAEPLPAPRHIFLNVANDAGVKYDEDGARFSGPDNTYYILADGGGLNQLHITNAVNNANGQVTTSNTQSGTFWITTTGGRGFNDDNMLLISVQDPIPDDFAVRIKSSGYTWTPNPSGPTGSTANLQYQSTALDETFTKDDFIYGLQTWKPGPGSLTVPSLSLWYGQSIADPTTNSYLMFIDLNAGNARTIPSAIDNGHVKVEFSFTNLATSAAFNAYSWCSGASATNEGGAISWTNRVSGSGSSGYRVLGTEIANDLATQDVQYSDEIHPVTISATDLTADKPLTVTSSYRKDGGSAVPGLPSGLSLSDETCTEDGAFSTCSRTVSGAANVPAGAYEVTATVTDKNSATDSTTFTVNVAKEDATIGLGNPVAFKVTSPGGTGSFTLSATVQETNPDLPVDSAQPGDIANAGLTMSLVPITSGSAITPTSTTVSVVGGIKTLTCSYANVPVNTYTLSAVVTGDYYAATPSEDVVVVYDSSLGHTTGGGWFYWPGTEEKTSFGYVMNYNKKGGSVKGNLVLIRHTDDGIYRLKSNALYGLAVNPSDGTASFSGKATYLEPGWADAAGNYEFVVYVDDNNEPGTGDDLAWISVKNGIGMALPAVDNAAALGGGNVFVPHTAG
jgi:hypothetical protein